MFEGLISYVLYPSEIIVFHCLKFKVLKTHCCTYFDQLFTCFRCLCRGMGAEIQPLSLSLRLLITGASLVVQWLRLCPSTAGGTGSVPGWGAQYGQNFKKERKNESLLITHK